MKQNYHTPKWNHQYEFVSALFLSWTELANAFGFTEEWDLADTTKAPDSDIVDVAYIEAQHLAQKYKEICHMQMEDTDLIKAENNIVKSILHHWSPQNVVSEHIDISALIAQINTWSQAGPKCPRLFPIEPTRGLGIEYFITPCGISFSLFPPFMIPYTEMYYTEHNELPEWNLDSIVGSDILEVLLSLYAITNGALTVDLSEWDSKRESVQSILTDASIDI